MIVVHPRVHQRHPELSDKDVLSAWSNQYWAAARLTETGTRYVAVGFDANNRELEMVAVVLKNGDWLIYHAMTPPSDRTRSELAQERSSNGLRNLRRKRRR